ncbi:MAG: EAL domain-containing protein [Sulfuricaulis sp.]|uniref:EAL domain-containing protein n=1 Tax=Sulfuricaulis sp. TaxID=2003553 RepID=UPI0034A51D59
MKAWNLQKRVLFLALAPLTVAVLLLSLHFTNARIQDLELALQNRGQTIAARLAVDCEDAMSPVDRKELVKIAQSALREKDVLAVSVSSMNGKILASATLKETKGKSSPLPEISRYKFLAPVYQREPTAQEEVSTGARKKQVGWVSVSLSGAALQTEQNKILIQSLLIVLIGLVVTVVFALRMARTVTQPVLALTKAVEKIKHGELDYRVATQSSGEVGRLEDGINAMAAALQEARDKEKKRAEDALFLEQVRAQVTLESIGDGVITTNAAGKIVYMNPVAEQYTEWKQADAQGLPLAEVFKIFDEDSNRLEEYPIHYCLQEGRVIRHDSHHLLMSHDGGKIEIQDSAAPIRDRDGVILGAVVVFHDVTEIQGMARRMAFLASHDPLTGLLNRREFETRLQQVLQKAHTGDKDHALLYMDLDQFKIVNDTCGHIAGDELLKQLAHHMQKEIRASDVLARLGGDEFGVVLEDCTIDKAHQIADLLRQSVKDFRFLWEGRTFEIGVSIGLVPIQHDSGSITEVLSAADSACYVAKDHGRNRIHIYQPGDRALAKRRGEMQWVQRLREGLENNSFDLYCQAIIPLNQEPTSTGRFYEILVRVQDEDLVLPAAFIPAAERYHLMPSIDRWVISTVFAMLEKSQTRSAKQGTAVGTRFAINLSGQSLGDDTFLEFVMQQFAQHRINPATICFEITETAAVANLARARDFIARFKGMGCQFALDDFGSGLSSFGYLKSLSVDYLKIAGDFIEGMIEDAVDLAMVDAINQIGHVMGITTVAESVEKASILNKLREMGVDYAQGRGIDTPKPLHQILQLPEQEWDAVRVRAREMVG